MSPDRHSQPRAPRFKWILDGATVGLAGSMISWNPEPGRNTPAPADEESRVVDRVVFSVREGRERDQEQATPE